eukprot:GHVT01079482.1.p1 GENE.GHVT01079482.1~~GHVT01079482.1.p1  ORF type:complete len:107 (-),score=4.60 GHVT01079482.1:6-326(-)
MMACHRPTMKPRSLHSTKIHQNLIAFAFRFIHSFHSSRSIVGAFIAPVKQSTYPSTAIRTASTTSSSISSLELRSAITCSSMVPAINGTITNTSRTLPLRYARSSD